MFTSHSGFPWTPVDGQSVQTPGGPTLAPTRPTEYFCCAENDHSNNAFIRRGGDFPNVSLNYFNIQTSGAPGIGRNSFRGPHYFDTDLSFAKNTKLPDSLHLGEAANLELRANFFSPRLLKSRCSENLPSCISLWVTGNMSSDVSAALSCCEGRQRSHLLVEIGDVLLLVSYDVS
jgi:hypothetical protein